MFSRDYPIPDECVVELEGVRKSYGVGKETVQALAGVDLRISRGSIHGIIGFSGAGKSTLLRCISRLEQPDAGRVIVAGSDLAHLEGEALRAARRKIGVVFQQLHLLNSRNVAANIGLPMELAGRPRRGIARRVDELLDWFGLGDKAKQYPAQLSGGQRQRVAVARALAMHPAVLLTDEPTSALDPETTAAVLALLQGVRRDFDVTILLITHELDAVRAICDRVAVLDAGRVVEEGPMEQVLLRPQSSAARRLVRREPGLTDASLWLQPTEHDTALLLELHLLGAVACEPILSRVAQKHNIDVTILKAHVDRLNEVNFGFLLIQLSGYAANVYQACESLRESGVAVTQLESVGVLR